MSEADYPRPSLTADVVLVTLGDAGLRVLLIRRKADPFAGEYALPGGFVEPTETVGEAASRELEEETGLTGLRLEQLGCFSKPGRDPRGWTVTVAHLGLVPFGQLGEVKAGDDASDAAWLDLTVEGMGLGFSLQRDGEPVKALAFDHNDILDAAVRYLVEHVDQVAFSLLPPAFTIAEAERAFAAILGERLDRAALGARLLVDQRIRETSAEDEGVQGARRYTFTGRRRPWPVASDVNGE